MAAAFTAATGYRVDLAELTWWNIFSCWKLAVIVLTGLHAFVTGVLDRIYHPPSFLYQTMLDEAAHAQWKQAVLNHEIELPELDTTPCNIYSHQNEDIVRESPAQLKARMAAKEAARR